MIFVFIAIGLLICALQAVRSQRLLHSALWLAGASALTALMMYLLGAPEVAVIELSVGAGLVTVLFVFAINIAGEESLNLPPIIPRPLAWMLAVGLGLLLGWLSLNSLGVQIGVNTSTGFAEVVWGERRLDVFLQIVLIFSGVLAVLGLLAEIHPSKAGHSAAAHGSAINMESAVVLEESDLVVAEPVVAGQVDVVGIKESHS